LKSGKVKQTLKLYDKPGAVIFLITVVDGTWKLGFLGTPEEIIKWTKRNGILKK